MWLTRCISNRSTNIIFLITILGLISTYTLGDRKYKYQSVLYSLLSMLVILTVCLHGETVGHDTHIYMYLYMNPDQMDFIPIEFVLPALVRILRTIYSNPYFINFTILLLSQIPLFILIKKFSKNRFFSVFLYLSYTASVSMFLHSMSAVRQTLAIGFFALAVYDYTSNKYNLNLRVIILLLLMCCSHISSIILWSIPS